MKSTVTALVIMAALVLMLSVPLAHAQAEKKAGAAKSAVKTIVFLVNEDEYSAAQTVPEFAKMLESKYGFKCECLVNAAGAKDPKRFNLPNVEKVKTADLVVVYMRRRALPKEQLALVREYLNAGKPLIGIRTASHAFDAKFIEPGDTAPPAKGATKLPEGLAQWKTFDKDVLGCSYHNHYGNKEGTEVSVIAEKKSHPLLAGVPEGFHSAGTLYMVMPLLPGAEALMLGKTTGKDPEPVLITNSYKKGSRIVYTTLGHPDDFKMPAFQRILVNSVFWTLKLEGPAE